ncbi:MAG: Arginine exporter protein ArgO [Alphaproteobacteria bacterium MarineAlpha3_Bin5]|nr:lysine efflux permease [Magnetovibrio sp.]PPR77300.1 MAG: Arginine exporter protein ArgO [Alphaproteobacteria bacterium MarineAlpha3_Bin5]
MISAFFMGLIVGFSLIIAIGPQNAFVFRNGLMRNRIGMIVLFCAFSDAFLIIIGVCGVSVLFNPFSLHYGKWLFYLAALWLCAYGILRARSALYESEQYYVFSESLSDRYGLFIQLAIFTFLNPHVYLDTVVLIGAISTKFTGTSKIAFGLGATSASFVFFSLLGYGAAYVSRFIQDPKFLRNVDLGIAVVMFGLAIAFFVEGQSFEGA